MAILKFRIYLEEDDSVYRDIAIRHTQNFFDLHEEFELLYNEARLNIDEIAERIRVFGMIPLSTMKEYLQYSDIQETSADIDAVEMVLEVLNDYTILLDIMNALIDLADKNDDSGTDEMIKRFIKKIEKHHWMLSAFSNQ